MTTRHSHWPSKNNHKSRRVDFLDNSSDYEAAFLGSMGMSTRCIQQRTKLSAGQITYRLRKAAIRRIDYRDGTSETATIVLRVMRHGIETELTKYLKGLFK